MNFRRLIRNLFVKTPYAPVADLTRKHAIVTGASGGSVSHELV